jgi:hypothetical protein
MVFILLTLKLYCDIKKMAVEANHTIVIMGDRLQTGEPYKGLAGAAVSPVLIAS